MQRVLPVINENVHDHAHMPRRAHTADTYWHDWHWQERNAVTSLEGLRDALGLDEDFLTEATGKRPDRFFYVKVTPHYLDHLRRLKEQHGAERIRPLLRMLLPLAAEDANSYEQVDGMGEDGTGQHQLISSLYADRGLLFITNRCPVHCRYCFRRRKINDVEHTVSWEDVYGAVERIRWNPNIRDVIISGGDPLTVSDNRLDGLLEALYEVDHVGLVRIDTKCATVLPQRFNPGLLSVLRKRKPLYMTLHFTHPDEISPETKNVCNSLADSGIVLGAYIPLLKGVNDNRETLKELFFSLAKLRVRPYYLVQNVTNKWNSHFQVPIERGLSLIDGLQGELSGVALPTFIVYLPEAGGKVPLQNNPIVKRTDEGVYIKNFQGRVIFYPDPRDDPE